LLNNNLTQFQEVFRTTSYQKSLRFITTSTFKFFFDHSCALPLDRCSTIARVANGDFNKIMGLIFS